MASTSTTLVYFCIITFHELASILDEEKSVINLIIKYSQRLLSYMYLKYVQICMFARNFSGILLRSCNSHISCERIRKVLDLGSVGGLKMLEQVVFLQRYDADIKTHTHTGVKRTYFCHRYVVFSIPICFLSSLSPPPL